MSDGIQLCANCDKPYEDHLLWDGNKCTLGSMNGWFPKTVAKAIKPQEFPDRPAAYKWGGTGDTLFYLKSEADKMFSEIEAAKQRWVDRANALEKRVRSLELTASRGPEGQKDGSGK